MRRISNALSSLLSYLVVGVHGAMRKWRPGFELHRNRLSERSYRIMNEVPTMLMIGIIVLAVVEPL